LFVEVQVELPALFVEIQVEISPAAVFVEIKSFLGCDTSVVAPRPTLFSECLDAPAGTEDAGILVRTRPSPRLRHGLRASTLSPALECPQRDLHRVALLPAGDEPR